jgi:hypothetical protein
MSYRASASLLGIRIAVVDKSGHVFVFGSKKQIAQESASGIN